MLPSMALLPWICAKSKRSRKATPMDSMRRTIKYSKKLLTEYPSVAHEACKTSFITAFLAASFVCNSATWTRSLSLAKHSRAYFLQSPLTVSFSDNPCCPHRTPISSSDLYFEPSTVRYYLTAYLVTIFLPPPGTVIQ